MGKITPLNLIFEIELLEVLTRGLRFRLENAMSLARVSILDGKHR
ncbi:hypothetical protein [Pseudomonas sp. SW-3]|jgi:hypothetical protein|nr:hypothetical protein [Pseudomonas sp. SW-3]